MMRCAGGSTTAVRSSGQQFRKWSNTFQLKSARRKDAVECVEGLVGSSASDKGESSDRLQVVAGKTKQPFT